MKDELIESILLPTDTSLDWKLKELAKNEISIDDIKKFFKIVDRYRDVEVIISKYKPFLREKKLKDLGL